MCRLESRDGPTFAPGGAAGKQVAGDVLETEPPREVATEEVQTGLYCPALLRLVHGYAESLQCAKLGEASEYSHD